MVENRTAGSKRNTIQHCRQPGERKPPKVHNHYSLHKPQMQSEGTLPATKQKKKRQLFSFLTPLIG
jgi:hypothetical protein